MNALRDRPAGYSFLIERYELNVVPNWHSSSIGSSSLIRRTQLGHRYATIYPASYWPGESSGDQLEFALKYEGVNLLILAALFERMAADEITAWIRSKPSGKYSRKIWFLYEFLCARELPLPQLEKGNYVELLESELYYTLNPGRRIKRQRVLDNLLGGRDFCPIVRRTPAIGITSAEELRLRCEQVVGSHAPTSVRRALHDLYSKETKSSFEIEKMDPSTARSEKFIGLLQLAEQKDFCTKAQLLELQNQIVDSRFVERNYRVSQNYVRQTRAYQKELVHYISPKLDDLGVMQVLGETTNYYRFMDLTAQAEALSAFVQLTLEQVLVEELQYLAHYDQAKGAMQAILDMPDRLLNLFIKICLPNKGRLSERKRASHFDFLSEEELASLEAAVRESFEIRSN